MIKKERLLVLCQAYPAISRTYDILICMAGITEGGEFRRIFPVPFSYWQKKRISKRSWIEYELKEDKSSDGRKESRKIVPASIAVQQKEDYPSIRKIVLENLSCIEDLNDDGRSLGMVKPRVADLYFEWKEARQKKQDILSKQRTLYDGPLDFYYPSELIKYDFHCCGSDTCRGHDIMCEDWEAISLYRKMDSLYQDKEVVHAKVKEKLFNWMLERRDLYFMMGTDARFGKWLIISLLYPKDSDRAVKFNSTLDEF